MISYALGLGMMNNKVLAVSAWEQWGPTMIIVLAIFRWSFRPVVMTPWYSIVDKDKNAVPNNNVINWICIPLQTIDKIAQLVSNKELVYAILFGVGLYAPLLVSRL